MRKIYLTLFLISLFPLIANGAIEESLSTEIKKLFQGYCPTQCLDVQVKVDSKTTTQKRYSEPGFEELGSQTQSSTAITNISANILIDESLSEKTKNFLKTYIEYLGQKYQAPVMVTYTGAPVPKSPLSFVKKGKIAQWAMFLVLILLSFLGYFFLKWFFAKKIFRSRARLSAQDDNVASKSERLPAPSLATSRQMLPSSAKFPLPPSQQLMSDLGEMEERDDLPIHAISEHFDVVKKILERWAQTPEGLGKVLQIISVLPPSLRNELRGIIQGKTVEEFREEYQKLNLRSKNDLRTVFRELQKEIEFENLLSSAEFQEARAFHFLDSFSPIKIVHLIRNEEPKNKALILIQLDPEKRAAVFQSFSQDEQRKIAAELGKLDLIQMRELKELGLRLAKRAAILKQLDIHEISGFHTLVALVEKSDDPERFITEIAQTDLKLGNDLRSHIISLELVEWLEDDALQIFLSQFERDELAALLIGRGSNSKEIILSKLSPQISEYVQFNLQPEFRKKISSKRVKDAEHKAYAVLRTLAKNGEFNVQEIQKKRTLWESQKIYTDDGMAAQITPS